MKMIEGALDPELAKAWAWDREQSGEPDGEMWPSRELKDLLKSSTGQTSPVKSMCLNL